MNDYRQKIGRFGEKLAADYLSGYGCVIIGKNFQTRYGEIDLIARQGDELLFCEVKTRTGFDYGYPEEAVGRHKIRHLLKAISAYLEWKQINVFWRLDVLSIIINKAEKTAKIKWFKNVSADIVY